MTLKRRAGRRSASSTASKRKSAEPSSMKHEAHITQAAEEAIEDASIVLCDVAELVRDPVVGPIYQTSLFTFSNYQAMEQAFAGGSNGYIYSRVGNPTVHDVERRIAELEGAEAARGFASGM